MSVYFKTFRNLLPELITVFSLTLMGIRDTGQLSTAVWLLLGACSLRIVWNSALIVHGFGHVCIIAILDRDLGFINSNNILENRGFTELLKSCVPGHPIFLPWIACETQPWVAAGSINFQTVRFKALGGIAFNAIAILFSLLLCSLFAQSNLGGPSAQLLIGAWFGSHLLVVLSSRSDITAAIAGQASCFYCGNFG
ncbi:hypothetical protein, partial [cf. Phormidesmis sp. LEGE 11477]|uniref:hypothetical protein n=1 Tax=cf. Phormidesmis sp. LEGE 11477 TaxID=1828680 RepID=UPI0019FD24C7